MPARTRRRTPVIVLAALVVAAAAAVAALALPSERGTPAVSALPDAAGMGEVELLVADLEPMTRFYRDGVGLAVLSSDESSAVLGTDGTALLRLVTAPDRAPDDRAQAGLYHSAFLYEADAELASAVARVATAFPASFQGASDHTVSNAFYFADPEGNGVELYVDLPRDTWTWVDGHVTMGTYALDPQSFLEEHLPASGPTVTARGVSMGHVHLRGGDVARAEQFYVDVVGMAVTSRIDSAVFLSAGGYHHHLAVNTWEAAGAGTRPDSRGLSHVTVTVPDEAAVNEVQARADAAGAHAERTEAGLVLRDPWGTRVVIRTSGSTER